MRSLVLLVGLWSQLAGAHLSPSVLPAIVFSAGFSDDMVLQRGPAQASVYGLVQTAPAATRGPAVRVLLEVADDERPSNTYSVEAEVLPVGTGGGAAGAGSGLLCSAQCVAAGHNCQGAASCCGQPSCDMGCAFARRVAGRAACEAQCEAAAAADCEYVFEEQVFNTCLPCPTEGGGSCAPPGASKAAECRSGCAHHFAAPAGGLSTFKALLRPAPPAGSFTLTATCTAGCSADVLTTGEARADDAWTPGRLAVHAPHISTRSIARRSLRAPVPGPSARLARVTFGDVFYCSGQSNMELPLNFTFEKPEYARRIRAGRYSNVRMFQYGNLAWPMFQETAPAFVTTTGGPIARPRSVGGRWWNASAAVQAGDEADRTGGGWRAGQPPAALAAAQRWAAQPRLEHPPPLAMQVGASPFASFSATCFYFAASLSDMLAERGGAPPIGVIEAAVGGSEIEAWLAPRALERCRQVDRRTTKISPPARLHFAMLDPFVNMTVAGWLWYQGENNVKHIMGNSIDATGYGCELQELVRSWRGEWSAARGTTPALAPFGVVTLAAGGSEGWPRNMSRMRWSQTANFGVLPNAALPRTFLAQAFDLPDPWLFTPLTQERNCSLPSDEGRYGPECLPWNATGWNAAVRPLAAAVRLNEPLGVLGLIHVRLKAEVGRRAAAALTALAYNGTGAVSGPTISGCSVHALSTGHGPVISSISIHFDTALLGDDTVAVQAFDADPGGWAPAYRSDSNSMMACVGLPADQPRCASSNPADMASLWHPVPVQPSPAPGTVVADIAGLPVNASSGETVLAVRYGWPLNQGDTCCPHEAAWQGLEPCKPAACPIMTRTSLLPANPFYADIVDGECKCAAPQNCSAALSEPNQPLLLA